MCNVESEKHKHKKRQMKLECHYRNFISTHDEGGKNVKNKERTKI
jgi:hypothetical protein